MPFRLASLNSLARLLRCPLSEVERIASRAGGCYRPFDRLRQRGTGTWRHIDNPTDELKQLQTRINKAILQEVGLPEEMLGGVPGCSIRDNMEPHISHDVVVAIDIKECFPSTSDKRVFEVFRHQLGCSPRVSDLLAKLTTLEHRLPQGAPTSPALANLVLLEVHKIVSAEARRLGLAFTFFVDDITLSGDRAREAIEPVIAAIQRAGYAIRHKKLRIMPRSRRQFVTGGVVNHAFSAGQCRVKALRQETYALSCCEHIFAHQLRSIDGKISHVASLNLVQGDSLRRLAARLLPATGDLSGHRVLAGETRPCSCARRHASRRGRGAQTTSAS